MTIKHSRSLLTEILMLLQQLNASAAQFEVELQKLNEDIRRVDKRLTEFIETYMPEEIAREHVQHHKALSKKGFIRRFFLKLGGADA